MKAFLLAAGLGTRLRPLTLTTPKCLLPIRGTPLLGVWFRLLKKHNVFDVLINTHHLAGQIGTYVNAHSDGLRVTLTYESQALGSAGTIRANEHFVAGEDDFYILYSDNLTDVDLTALLRFHRRHGELLTMGLKRMENPENRGIASLDEEGKVIEFEEKPQHPKSDLANAGIFVASPKVISYIPEKIPSDIGYDLLPRLPGHMYGCLLQGYLRDIGTVESYDQAQVEWEP